MCWVRCVKQYKVAQAERLYTTRGRLPVQSLAEKMEIRKDPATASAFKSVPFDVLWIASNHIGDFGPEAAEDTWQAFQDIGIPTIGGGRNIAERALPS